MRRHLVKSWPAGFTRIATGEDTKDVRLNDRNYQVGEQVLLQEWRPDVEVYTTRLCLVEITEVRPARGGYVVLTYRRVPWGEW